MYANRGSLLLSKIDIVNKKSVKIFPNLAGVRRTAADAIFGSPTEFLAVLGLQDTRYFDPCMYVNINQTLIKLNVQCRY